MPLERDWLSLSSREREGAGSRGLRLQSSSLVNQCLALTVSALTYSVMGANKFKEDRLHASSMAFICFSFWCEDRTLLVAF